MSKLHEAVKAGDLKSVKQAIKNGCEVNGIDIEGQTPLHSFFGNEFAPRKPDIKILKTLLVSGAKVNLKEIKGGFAPLHFAMHAINSCMLEDEPKYFEAIMLLLNSDADVNSRSVSKFTPLHLLCSDGAVYACKYDSFSSTFEALVKKGVKINAVDKDGWTSLHCACQSCADSYRVPFLLKHGAKDIVNKKDRDGNTPLDIAWDRATTQYQSSDKYKQRCFNNPDDDFKDEWYIRDESPIIQELEAAGGEFGSKAIMYGFVGTKDVKEYVELTANEIIWELKRPPIFFSTKFGEFLSLVKSRKNLQFIKVLKYFTTDTDPSIRKQAKDALKDLTGKNKLF